MTEMDWGRAIDNQCGYCRQSLYQGFAKCHLCGAIRPEFTEFKHVIRDKLACCEWSGADTDVVLPNGHPLWAPYLLAMLEAGWLDDSLKFTALAYEKHPQLRSTNR